MSIYDRSNQPVLRRPLEPAFATSEVAVTRGAAVAVSDQVVAVTDPADYGQIMAAVQPLLMREAKRWADRAGWAPTGFDVQHDGRPCPGS